MFALLKASQDKAKTYADIEKKMDHVLHNRICCCFDSSLSVGPDQTRKIFDLLKSLKSSERMHLAWSSTAHLYNRLPEIYKGINGQTHPSEAIKILNTPQRCENFLITTDGNYIQDKQQLREILNERWFGTCVIIVGGTEELVVIREIATRCNNFVLVKTTMTNLSTFYNRFSWHADKASFKDFLLKIFNLEQTTVESSFGDAETGSVDPSDYETVCEQVSEKIFTEKTFKGVDGKTRPLKNCLEHIKEAGDHKERVGRWNSVMSSDSASPTLSVGVHGESLKKILATLYCGKKGSPQQRQLFLSFGNEQSIPQPLPLPVIPKGYFSGKATSVAQIMKARTTARTTAKEQAQGRRRENNMGLQANIMPFCNWVSHISEKNGPPCVITDTEATGVAVFKVGRKIRVGEFYNQLYMVTKKEFTPVKAPFYEANSHGFPGGPFMMFPIAKQLGSPNDELSEMKLATFNHLCNLFAAMTGEEYTIEGCIKLIIEFMFAALLDKDKNYGALAKSLEHMFLFSGGVSFSELGDYNDKLIQLMEKIDNHSRVGKQLTTLFLLLDIIYHDNPEKKKNRQAFLLARYVYTHIWETFLSEDWQKTLELNKVIDDLNAKIKHAQNEIAKKTAQLSSLGKESEKTSFFGLSMTHSSTLASENSSPNPRGDTSVEDCMYHYERAWIPSEDFSTDTLYIRTTGMVKKMKALGKGMPPLGKELSPENMKLCINQLYIWCRAHGLSNKSREHDRTLLKNWVLNHVSSAQEGSATAYAELRKTKSDDPIMLKQSIRELSAVVSTYTGIMGEKSDELDAIDLQKNMAKAIEFIGLSISEQLTKSGFNPRDITPEALCLNDDLIENFPKDPEEFLTSLLGEKFQNSLGRVVAVMIKTRLASADAKAMPEKVKEVLNDWVKRKFPFSVGKA